MKNITILIITLHLCFSFFDLMAQSVAINDDGSAPDASAILDVKSTTKGLLLPRMTGAQIEAIVSPTDGLMVYNTDEKRFYFFDGGASEWKELGTAAPPFVCGTSSITDVDGNSYSTVSIDSKCYMGENLATTKYNDGTSIPYVTDNSSWSSLTTPAYCWYNNDQSTYGSTYGILYNWYAVNTGNLCPEGWHVPDDTEWQALVTYLGGNSPAGGKLKETGTTHWSSPNGGATNETGFTALPGGHRNTDGTFNNLSLFCYLWSASDADNGTKGESWNTSWQDAYIWPVDADKKEGHSIRCVKD